MSSGEESLLLAYRLYTLLWRGLDWIYPPLCGGCGERGKRWCEHCQQASQLLLYAKVCERCGVPLSAGRLCARCREEPPAYTALRSWAVYAGPLRRALHRLKYGRDIALGEALARHLVGLYQSCAWPVEAVIAVPMGIAHRAKRGYNQAALLALPLALAIGKPLRNQALRKRRETLSQVGLGYAERRANVAQAFQAERRWVEGRCVLVVDDIATSGATMQACAEALLEAGASQVFGVTLARATLEEKVEQER